MKIDIKYLSSRFIRKMTLDAGIQSISAETVQALNVLIEEVMFDLIETQLKDGKLELESVKMWVGAYFEQEMADMMLKYGQEHLDVATPRAQAEGWEAVVFDGLAKSSAELQKSTNALPPQEIIVNYLLYGRLNAICQRIAGHPSPTSPEIQDQFQTPAFFEPTTIIFLSGVASSLSLHCLRVICDYSIARERNVTKMEDMLQSLLADPLISKTFARMEIRAKLEKKVGKKRALDEKRQSRIQDVTNVSPPVQQVQPMERDFEKLIFNRLSTSSLDKNNRRSPIVRNVITGEMRQPVQETTPEQQAQTSNINAAPSQRSTDDDGPQVAGQSGSTSSREGVPQYQPPPAADAVTENYATPSDVKSGVAFQSNESQSVGERSVPPQASLVQTSPANEKQVAEPVQDTPEEVRPPSIQIDQASIVTLRVDETGERVDSDQKHVVPVNTEKGRQLVPRDEKIPRSYKKAADPLRRSNSTNSAISGGTRTVMVSERPAISDDSMLSSMTDDKNLQTLMEFLATTAPDGSYIPSKTRSLTDLSAIDNQNRLRDLLKAELTTSRRTSMTDDADLSEEQQDRRFRKALIDFLNTTPYASGEVKKQAASINQSHKSMDDSDMTEEQQERAFRRALIDFLNTTPHTSSAKLPPRPKIRENPFKTLMKSFNISGKRETGRSALAKIDEIQSSASELPKPQTDTSAPKPRMVARKAKVNQSESDSDDDEFMPKRKQRESLLEFLRDSGPTDFPPKSNLGHGKLKSAPTTAPAIAPQPSQNNVVVAEPLKPQTASPQQKLGKKLVPREASTRLAKDEDSGESEDEMKPRKKSESLAEFLKNSEPELLKSASPQQVTSATTPTPATKPAATSSKKKLVARDAVVRKTDDSDSEDDTKSKRKNHESLTDFLKNSEPPTPVATTPKSKSSSTTIFGRKSGANSSSESLKTPGEKDRRKSIGLFRRLQGRTVAASQSSLKGDTTSNDSISTEPDAPKVQPGAQNVNGSGFSRSTTEPRPLSVLSIGTNAASVPVLTYDTMKKRVASDLEMPTNTPVNSSNSEMKNNLDRISALNAKLIEAIQASLKRGNLATASTASLAPETQENLAKAVKILKTQNQSYKEQLIQLTAQLQEERVQHDLTKQNLDSAEQTIKSLASQLGRANADKAFLQLEVNSLNTQVQVLNTEHIDAAEVTEALKALQLE